jgi:hypothetical protein
MSLEYIFESCKQNVIPSFTEELILSERYDFRNLKILEERLKFIAKSPNLRRLSLRKTYLTATGLKALSTTLFESKTILDELNISCNELYLLDDLKPLQTLSTLISLDISNCPICTLLDWRNKVLDILPNLRFINNEPVRITSAAKDAIECNKGGANLIKFEELLLSGRPPIRWLKGIHDDIISINNNEECYKAEKRLQEKMSTNLL